ncbi:MAG: Bax inhibitor-1/YccA family protein [Micrococcaceae bacterium]
MANPIFSHNKTFSGNQPTNQPMPDIRQFEDMYQAPSATPQQMRRMTYDDVIMKSLISFATVVVGAVVGWMIPALSTIGMIVGVGLGLYLGFSGKNSKQLILTYAAAQGLFVGGFTHILETMYPGIAVQAILGTFAVFVASFMLYKSGRFHSSPKFQRMLSIAMFALFIFSMLNILLMLTGVTQGSFGMYSAAIPGTSIPFGLVLGPLAILLGAYSLVNDFQSVDDGVRNGAPAEMAWTAAFGITMTMLWLYVEILRLIAIIRQGDNN